MLGDRVENNLPLAFSARTAHFVRPRRRLAVPRKADFVSHVHVRLVGEYDHSNSGIFFFAGQRQFLHIDDASGDPRAV